MSNIKYAKHNSVRFKSLEDRQSGLRMFNKFFIDIEKSELNEMRGHIILESITDAHEAVVLTFWETKDGMDRFYSPQNTSLTKLVEEAKPLFEKMPERVDFAVPEFSV